MPEPDHARPADDGWDRPWFSNLGRGRDDNEPGGGDGWGNEAATQEAEAVTGEGVTEGAAGGDWDNVGRLVT
ncbi:hypothetical protein ACFWHF_13490 [Streptomyces griseoincarnatus]|uniref:hypothetical protein n=1 Tax=Streptomyces sp. TRM75561 TaxID=2975269 RepID=UPI00244B7CC1|nr:hypothetical protein [Streptomyces sp. TRM75561]MDH3037310.1 hypothetical protein [Streptomyces sp. TRM75561]